MRSAASAILYEFPAKIVLSAPGPVFTTAFQTTTKQPQTTIWKSPVVSGRFSCLCRSERLGTTQNDPKRPETTIWKPAFIRQPLLVCCRGIRMHVRMIKRKLKNRPRKLRPARRCFLSTFTLITCRSFIILNFIYARKATQMQVRKLL